MSRFRTGAVLAALLLVLSALPARAVGRVIPSSDGPVQLDALRVAVAVSSHQTTLWTAFRLSGSAKRAAVVFPVMPGSLVDPASAAWFRALEGATAPRVLAPGGMPDCPQGSSNQVDNTADDAPAASLHPLEVAVLDTPADLDDYAAKHQLALSPADRAALDVPGQRLVIVLYALPQGGSAFTQTLRISEPAELHSLPLALARTGGSPPVPFTLWTIASGRARLSPGKELAPKDVKAVWHEYDGNSDYVQRRRDLLESAAGASFLRESSGNSRLFGWTVLSGQGGSVPPAADGYFGTAAELGDTSSDPADCAQAAAQARVAGSIGMPVADACAPGLLARVPLDGGAVPTCTEQTKAGSVDPDTLRCGAADDFALALSGLRADHADLVRFSGVLGSSSADVTQMDQVAPAPRSPGVVASALDSSGCQYLPTGGSGGSSSWGNQGSGGSGYGGSGGYAGYSGSGGYAGSYSSSSPDVNVDMSCTNSGGDSCSGDSSSSSGDSCSGDSSSSSSGDSCSGDSSSSSDGATCSGDSSSSSDGATCSGDSSSSSSDGATCSGDSSGSDGATCSGDSSGGDSSCALSPGRHAHLSAWTIGLVALLLPSRRLTRRFERRARRRRHRIVRAGRRW